MNLHRFAEFALEAVKEAIREGCFDIDAETLADEAVECGLIEKVPYDPEKHGYDGDLDPGDLIYYWTEN